MRVYIFTDTHLGYKERDEKLGNDSFESFEEGLINARMMNSHMALHSGDLFDIQKPSQSTMHKAMALLARYCLENEPFSNLSIPTPIIECQLKTVRRHKPEAVYNFERAHLRNVALPLFMIYGNHDPPVTHHDGQVVSPIDVLQAAYLVNDIGKHDDLDPVLVTPFVLEHEGILIALYGVGYIQDERMNRLFEHNKIHFEPPPKSVMGAQNQVLRTECFCILLFHQNRFKGQLAAGGAPAKRCVHEEMLPSFFDLIIWGHEHDCDIELRECIGSNTTPMDMAASPRSQSHSCKITQPGSSVYTSLKRGEATLKRNALLEILPGKKIRFISFPLLSLRPLIFRQVNVMRQDENLVERLVKETTIALEDAKSFLAEQEIEWKTSVEKISSSIVKVPENLAEVIRLSCGGFGKLPLLRLRVEVPYEFNLDDFSTTHFSGRYQNQVGNYEDIIAISRAGKGGKKIAALTDRQSLDTLEDVTMPEDDDDPEEMIFDLVTQTASLQLLEEIKLNECVKRYVDKSDLNVFEDLIDNAHNIAMKALSAVGSQDANILSQTLLALKNHTQATSSKRPSQLIEEAPSTSMFD